jgi:hypothetical protein
MKLPAAVFLLIMYFVGGFKAVIALVIGVVIMLAVSFVAKVWFGIDIFPKRGG